MHLNYDLLLQQNQIGNNILFKVGPNPARQMIAEKVKFHTIIQGIKSIGKNNQISFHKTKDTAINNQISIIVSYTLNEKA